MEKKLRTPAEPTDFLPVGVRFGGLKFQVGCRIHILHLRFRLVLGWLGRFRTEPTECTPLAVSVAVAVAIAALLNAVANLLKMASRARRYRSPCPNGSEGGDDDGHGDVGESSNPKDPRIAVEIADGYVVHFFNHSYTYLIFSYLITFFKCVGNLTEPDTVSRNSTKIFKKSLHEEGLTWGLVPNEITTEKLFSWNRAHDSAVRGLWMAKVGPLYNDMLCKARKKRKMPDLYERTAMDYMECKMEN